MSLNLFNDMKKIDKNFTLHSYQKGIALYTEAANNLGLWASEEYVLNKYFSNKDHILDVGCGAGRTTFGLHQLGFHNIIGIDIHPDMISSAKELANQKQVHLDFRVGDATNLEFEASSFDSLLFSFNGVMTIPGPENRIKAFQEVHRVLKPNGIFIFTTHDREADKNYHEFWEKEKIAWKTGQQDKRLHEFGDIVNYSSDVMQNIYVHIPDRQEVVDHLSNVGFKVVEDFFRPDRFEEREAVLSFSGDCRIWVAQKTA